MKYLSILLFTFSLYNCQSREYKSVSISDEKSANATVDERQNLEEARQLIASGSNDFQKGNIEEALQKGNASIKAYELSDGYALIGASQYQLGEYEKSKLAYQKGKNLDPKDEKILIGLGTVQSTLGENEEALKSYQALSLLKPEETIYKYKVGLLLKNLSRFDESLVTLRPLDENKDFPYPIDLLNQLGDVCLELKKYEEAETYFARAEKLNPDLKAAKDAKQSTKIASYIQKGNDAIAKKKYPEAISEFKKATELQPKNGSLWSFLGNAEFLNNRYKDAEESFKKSVSLSDTNPNSYIGLCNVYIKLHNYSECLKVSKQGLFKIPKNPEIKNKQGICEWKWGEHKKATLSFQDASSWDPNYLEPKMNLAYVLIDQNRFDEALDSLRKVETHPKANKEEITKARILAESQKFITEGDSFLRQDKRKQAINSYGRALGVNPQSPSPHNAFGRAYFAYGDYKKSELSYLEAYRLDSENPGAIQGLVRVYAKTGESKKEKDYLKKLEKLSSEDPFSAITLGRIAEDAGKWTDAEKIYFDLKKKFPNHDAVDFRLGTLYYKRAVEENSKENYVKANEYIQKSKKYSNEIPEVLETEKTISENSRFAEILPLVREGNTLFNKKKFLEAITPYQKAYDRVPKASLLVKIAECYIEKGEEEKGLSILETAVRTNKENETSFREGIYAFYYKKNELKKAEEGFLNIIKSKPNAYYSYYMLGLISMKRKNYEAAIFDFDRSILVNGEFAPTNVGKGLAFYKLGQIDQAKNEFEKARAKDSEFGLSSYNLAIAYFNEDLTKEAKEILTSIRKSDPDFNDGEIQLAYIYFKENKLDEAEKIIESVLVDDPSAEALYASFRILDAKQKQNPSEKNKSKRNNTKAKILKEHGDSKFARLLPSDDLDDAPLHVTDLGLSGTPVSEPILYPNRIILNYGSALAGFDRITKESVWKNYVSKPYSVLIPGKEIFAAEGEVLTRIYPDNGKFASKVTPLPGWTIKKGAAGNAGVAIYFENVKSKSKKLVIYNLSLEPSQELVGGDIIDFGFTENGNLLLIRDTKKEIKLQSVVINFSNDKLNVGSAGTSEVSILKKDQKLTPQLLACLKNSCLVQLGSEVVEWDGKGKSSSLGDISFLYSTVQLGDSYLFKTKDKVYLWKGGSKWKDTYQSDADFYLPLEGAVLEGKTKELVLTKDKKSISIPWQGGKDGLKISTVTID